ncbi:hypothetical protein PC116_g12549 [Phytophthora cactorum]|nr:hypothetical protein Pcac1_g18414 [Phytophthora cactorum]KAG4239448.1 hypothetical protein PC116_g12549 [Phytophthora cactorum]
MTAHDTFMTVVVELHQRTADGEVARVADDVKGFRVI